jgi:UDP-N-acetylglucosamine 2-epimerase (non-hydrolysing)
MRADGSRCPDLDRERVSASATVEAGYIARPMAARLILVVGARPNFVKVAPVWHALASSGTPELELLHTGQHYDAALSASFLTQLDLPDPEVFLGAGSGSHAEQTAAVMIGVERHLQARPADAILVAGDVNSTMAAALAARKLGVAVIHLEAGLRSGDWSMPEEINRMVTDRIADLLLCPSDDARANLLAEGIPDARIGVVGNTMIDSLRRLLPSALAQSPRAALGLQPQRYVLATLHRPALVDDPDQLVPALGAIARIAELMPVVLPLHPRTRARLSEHGTELPEGVLGLEPLGYADFIALEAEARLVITDSGGVQEETSALQVPCLTYRDTTERPITITLGTNTLVGLDPDRLWELSAIELHSNAPKRVRSIPLWDGNAATRVAGMVSSFLARTMATCMTGGIDGRG